MKKTYPSPITWKKNSDFKIEKKSSWLWTRFFSEFEINSEIHNSKIESRETGGEGVFLALHIKTNVISMYPRYWQVKSDNKKCAISDIIHLFKAHKKEITLHKPS